ncbi:MAG TPA: carbohydrate ABC transporter permease [Microvirga sp.]|jgi:multiple sugar transport system permease protein|nr:carbohydrate ABC transporter permease [Microvirga sp.]
MPTPIGVTLATAGTLTLWIIVAAFPLAWVLVMSIKLPVDAFSSDPLQVIFGPRTLAAGEGWSLLDIVGALAVVYAGYKLVARQAAVWAHWLSFGGLRVFGWLLTAILVVGGGVLAIGLVLPAGLRLLNAGFSHVPGLALLAEPIIGATGRHYWAVWVRNGFYRNFVNSMIVTGGVVTISLTVGTLAGYALARMKSSLAFWLLITALVFRALPHSVLVTGYLLPFINSRELLMPLWATPILGDVLRLFSATPPTLYGQPWAVIAVLVAINQPFTIWMMRSFFQNVPAELDEAARVDGCTHFQAFRRVIMPVMWPGIITTGLFSFLLAYNDYLVTALLLDAQSQTMVPAITSYFNRETTSTDQIEAVAAAVSITAPLFFLVLVFQRQIVSGLTAGAVKG